MKKLFVVLAMGMQVYACTVAGRAKLPAVPAGSYTDTLRFLYSQHPSGWPSPKVDGSVKWTELGAIPVSIGANDSIRKVEELGAVLFFDPRLSESNKISCASCHVPNLSWTDGRPRSLGHEEQMNKRNSPTILNTWFYKELFWDGRSRSLEDQAFSPINSETEMHSDMPSVISKLRRIKGYRSLFVSAFGSTEISAETVTGAMAAFQRTVRSQSSPFDKYLNGDSRAISDEAVRGLHLFRTRAGCMNCHHGNMFSDDKFHNTGIDDFERFSTDKGRYNFTHKEEDAGKFRTPSLRDVSRTGPWMHNGSFNTLAGIIELYNEGMEGGDIDKRLPAKDPLIRKLGLSKNERQDLLAFLEAISADPPAFEKPVLPGN